MDVSIVASTAETAYVIKNLYPLYLHDLAEFTGELPNEHGVIEPTPVRSVAEQGDVQNVWWERPGVLFPLLVLVDARPAGFCLVATAPHVPAGVRYSLSEFFVARPFRRKGVGRAAATRAIEAFRGRWNVQILANNLPARLFWAKTIGAYTAGRFDASVAQRDGSDMVVFRFDNTPHRAE